MRATCVIIFAIAIFSLFSATAAEFSGQTAKVLLNEVGKNTLTTGEQNERNISGAVGLMGTRFVDCDPRICFALDGSGSISEEEYLLQKIFVRLVAAVLIGPVKGKAAAVQYGGVISIISQLTEKMLEPNENDEGGFMDKVASSEYIGSAVTFVAPGLQWCVNQIRDDPGGTNAIVLLGDGMSNFGNEKGPFGAVGVAKTFRGMEGRFDVYAVQVGRTVETLFRDVVGAEKEKLLQVKNWESLTDVLKTLVRQVCT